MMLRLAIAQLRANRSFTLWTAGLMTILVAILAYIVIAGATQATISREAAAVYGGDRDSYGAVSFALSPPIQSVVAPDAQEGTQGVIAEPDPGIAPSDFDAALASSKASDAMAIAQNYLRTSPIERGDAEWWMGDRVINTVALRGNVEIPALAHGVAPAHLGEVTLASNVARRLGVSIGDDLTLYPVGWQPDTRDQGTTPRVMKVVGLAASNDLIGYDVYLPDAYVSWDEVTTPEGVLVSTFVQFDENQVPVRSLEGYADVHWTGDDKALDPYRMQGWITPTPSDFSLPHATVAWFGAAIALFIAMIVMSFAVGRSQASARTQWVATVRTMGARRAHIVAAATLESLLLAAIAVVAGTGLGVALAQVQLSFARAQSGAPFGPSAIAWHWVIIPVVIAAGVVVAVVVAAVPAFWAARVAPTAALKPVSDVTETELSRRVPVLWLIIPFAVGAGLVELTALDFGAPVAAVAVLGWIIVIVAGFALVVEVLRVAIASVGRGLAHSPHPSMLTAGDALATRPRQAVAPALLMAVAVSLLTLWSCVQANSATEYLADGEGGFAGLDPPSRDYLRSNLLGFTTIATITIAALALQLVAAAIITSHRAATSNEAAARRAMGLSRRGEAIALWWQQWLPQAVGVCVGLVVGMIGFLARASVSQSPFTDGVWRARFAALGYGAAYSAVVAAAMLAVADLVAALAARASRAATPLAALAPAG